MEKLHVSSQLPLGLDLSRKVILSFTKISLLADHPAAHVTSIFAYASAICRKNVLPVDMAVESLESSMRPNSEMRKLPEPISLILHARMSLDTSLILSNYLRKDLYNVLLLHGPHRMHIAQFLNLKDCA